MALVSAGTMCPCVARRAAPKPRPQLPGAPFLALRQPSAAQEVATSRRVRLRRYQRRAIAEPPSSNRGDGEPQQPEISPLAKAELSPLSPLGDNLMTFALIAPLVVSFWRGGWELMDAYFFPGDKLSSAWFSFIFGIIIMTLVKVSEPRLVRGDNELLNSIQERAFTLTLAVGGLGVWHGLWCGRQITYPVSSNPPPPTFALDTTPLGHLYDEYLDFLGPVDGPWLSFIIGAVGLLCLRNLRSVLPVPSATLALDDDKQYGLSIGTLKAALKSRGWKSLW